MGQQASTKTLSRLLLIALVLRVVAAIFSAGYMAHDDHFETVRIAWQWHHEGMFLEDGTLRWDGKPEIGVLRSAVYNLFILGLMKITALFGVEHLDSHMIFNRFVHALLSMLPVVFGIKYLRRETDDDTAMIGGRMLATHFLMPFLGVRNLVEMVAADLIMPCIFYAHRSVQEKSDKDALIAALFGGFAFMVRMHVAVALVVVPVAMIIQKRAFRQAVTFSAGILAFVLIQGLLDVWTHGKFLGSVTNYIIGNMSQPPTLPGPWYRYILLILGIMLPPFSILFIGSMFTSRLIRKNLIAWSATVVCVLVHSIITNKQERFIIPVFPLIIVLGCVGLYYLYESNGWYYRMRWLRRGLWIWFWVLNTAALVPFTVNYAHKGAVDSLAWLSRQSDADSVLFDTTERKRWIPFDYWNYKKPGAVQLTPTYSLQQAIESGEVDQFNAPKYVVIFADGYPKDFLNTYRMSMRATYDIVHHGEPSLIDLILHKLNPKYNHKNETWVGRLRE